MWHAFGRITISLNARPRLEDYDLSGTREGCPYRIKRGDSLLYPVEEKSNAGKRQVIKYDSSHHAKRRFLGITVFVFGIVRFILTQEFDFFSY